MRKKLDKMLRRRAALVRYMLDCGKLPCWVGVGDITGYMLDRARRKRRSK